MFKLRLIACLVRKARVKILWTIYVRNAVDRSEKQVITHRNASAFFSYECCEGSIFVNFTVFSGDIFNFPAKTVQKIYRKKICGNILAINYS